MSAYPQRDVRLWRAYGSMSLQSAVGLLRNHEFEYVGLEDHKDGHHDRQADRPLQDQAQEVSLLALEARGARSDGKVLRRDHLPVSATPSHPMIGAKNGNRTPVAAAARPRVKVMPA